MIQEVKMFEVVCDNCKESFEDYEGFGVWREKIDAEEAAMKKEWLRMGETHICTNCYSINEDDKIIVDGDRHKN